MEGNLCWIGYNMQRKPLTLEINISLTREVDKFEDAKSGLDATTAKQYPLILVNDDLPAGGLVLPEQISLDDVVQIGCHVIKKIRLEGSNISTPILVTHIGNFVGYVPKNAIKLYMNSGANECIDISQCSLSEFANAVGNYL